MEVVEREGNNLHDTSHTHSGFRNTFIRCRFIKIYQVSIDSYRIWLIRHTALSPRESEHANINGTMPPDLSLNIAQFVNLMRAERYV